MSRCLSCGVRDVQAGTLTVRVDIEEGIVEEHLHFEAEVDVCRECARRLADGHLLTGRITAEDVL